MDFALQINNLCKSYKNTNFKLQNVSFNIPKGSIMGFVGKNGAGKSTTIQTILNILHKDSGEVIFFGNEMTDNSLIGIIFTLVSMGLFVLSYFVSRSIYKRKEL